MASRFPDKLPKVKFPDPTPLPPSAEGSKIDNKAEDISVKQTEPKLDSVSPIDAKSSESASFEDFIGTTRTLYRCQTCGCGPWGDERTAKEHLSPIGYQDRKIQAQGVK